MFKEAEGSESKRDTENPKQVTVDSTEKPHSNSVSEAGVQRIAHAPLQGSATIQSYNGVAQETLVCVPNLAPFRQGEMVHTIAPSGDWSSASIAVTTSPSKVFVPHVIERVPGVFSEVLSTRTEESISLQQYYKHASNSSVSTVSQTVERPLTASIVLVPGLGTSRGENQSQQNYGNQPSTVKNKQLYNMACMPTWVVAPKDMHTVQEGATMGSGAHPACDMLHPNVTQRQTQGMLQKPAGVDTFSSNMVVTKESMSHFPVSCNSVSIKKESETSACFYGDSSKKNESIETKLNKSVGISTNHGTFGATYTTSNKAQLSKSAPDSRTNYDRPAVTGAGMNCTVPLVTVDSMLSANRTFVPSPRCANSPTVIASLSDSQIPETSRLSLDEMSRAEVFSEDEVRWNSLVNSSVSLFMFIRRFWLACKLPPLLTGI